MHQPSAADTDRRGDVVDVEARAGRLGPTATRVYALERGGRGQFPSNAVRFSGAVPMTVYTGRAAQTIVEASDRLPHLPLSNITCRRQRLRRNCIRDRSSPQRRVGALPAVNDPHASSI
jgi:hypothetical protein